MGENIKSVADTLEGTELKNGWTVVERINPDEDSTGGNFSIPYKVEKDGEVAFLKALNFKAFFNIQSQGAKDIRVVDVMQEFLETFQFERDLTLKCRSQGLGNVIRLLDEGEHEISGVPYGRVPYLIFEMADGDVRSKLDYSSNIEAVWKLKSLHGVAKGLKQLHGIKVSHQDLKPSNVLVCEGELSKIGDLGRSQAIDFSSPHGDLFFSGDRNYAPPEILYRNFESDWIKRTFAIDTYLLGGLMCYYFTGLSMNALLIVNLEKGFYWDSWTGEWENVKPYLLDAFDKSLSDFSEHIFIDDLSSELTKILNQLCHPFPEERGHPINISSKSNSYSLIRYVTAFDRLHKSVKYKLFK